MPMLRATNLIRKGHWSGEAADVVELDYDERHRRRIRLTGRGGQSFLLDLERATMLEDGDALTLDDGRMVAVRAKPEPVMDVCADTPRELARLAWHVGNRHLPAQIDAGSIRLRQDHVIAAMLRGLGANVVEHEAPFDPEGGAYAQGGHDHASHDHGETQGHGHHHHHHGDGQLEHSHEH